MGAATATGKIARFELHDNRSDLFSYECPRASNGMLRGSDRNHCRTDSTVADCFPLQTIDGETTTCRMNAMNRQVVVSPSIVWSGKQSATVLSVRQWFRSEPRNIPLLALGHS